MSLTAILAAVGGLIVLIAGIFIGKPIGKSQGVKEGAQQAQAEQQITQAKAITEAVQERANVEVKVAATPRADIDRELSEFSRPD